MQYFPKGHKVIMATALNEYKFWNAHNKGAGSISQDDDKVYVECFVSGHTEEKGLSIVCLANPEWCLLTSTCFNLRNTPVGVAVMEGVALGYIYIPSLLSIKDGLGYGVPVCPY